jgi:hypothetical protein
VRGDNLVLAAEADAGARAFLEAREALHSGAALAAIVAGVSETFGPCGPPPRAAAGRRASCWRGRRRGRARERGVGEGPRRDPRGPPHGGATGFGAERPGPGLGGRSRGTRGPGQAGAPRRRDAAPRRGRRRGRSRRAVRASAGAPTSPSSRRPSPSAI